MKVNRGLCWQAKCIYLYFYKFLVQVISLHKEERRSCFRCIFYFLTVDLQSCLGAVLPYPAAEGTWRHWHASSPLRVFPEHSPGMARKSEKCSLDWLTDLWNLKLTHFYAPDESTVGFFTPSGPQGSGELLGTPGYSVSLSTRLCVSSKGKTQSPLPPSVRAHGKHC